MELKKEEVLKEIWTGYEYLFDVMPEPDHVNDWVQANEIEKSLRKTLSTLVENDDYIGALSLLTGIYPGLAISFFAFCLEKELVTRELIINMLYFIMFQNNSRDLFFTIDDPKWFQWVMDFLPEDYKDCFAFTMLKIYINGKLGEKRDSFDWMLN